MPARAVSTLQRLAMVALAAIAMLGALEVRAALPEALAKVKPAVVAVGTYQKLRNPPFVFRGTGFAVGDGRIVATNAHVLPESLNTEGGEIIMVLVHVPGGSEPQQREARAINVDRDHDLALLRIAGPPLPAVSFGDSSAVRDGQTVAFTGFPIGNSLGFYPVTHQGIIASLTPIAIPAATASRLDPRIVRNIKAGPFTLFQLDAVAYPGHSGSPLYDVQTGEVIGVVNMGMVKGTKDNAVGQPSGISFAVPARHVQDLLKEAR